MTPFRRGVGLAVAAGLAACAAAAPQEARPGTPPSRPLPERAVALRLRPDGRLETPAGPVPAKALAGPERDALLRPFLAACPPNQLAALHGLPPRFDARPVVIDADPAGDLRDLHALIDGLAAAGPPHFINLRLRTPEGAAAVPVLVPLDDKTGRLDDHRPYAWAFFADDQLQGWDWDPDPPPQSAPQSITPVRLAPLGSGEFLMHVNAGGLGLVPPERPLMKGEPPPPPRAPRASIRPDAWGKLALPLEQHGTWLSREGAEPLAGRKDVRVAGADLRNPLRLSGERWHVVDDAKAVEEALAGLTGPERPLLLPNRVLVYTLHRTSPRATVGDFLRALELARRYGFKGVFTLLERS